MEIKGTSAIKAPQVHVPSREEYERAQKAARAAGKPCWKLFGCQVTYDKKFGVLCKGDCPVD